MPKISVHGGPTHKGDPPKPTRRSFGEALKAARAGQELPPAEEATAPKAPQAEQVTVTLDVTQTDERLEDYFRDLMRRWVRADGGGNVTSAQTDADVSPVSDSGPGALPPADDLNEEREHPGAGVEMTAVEATAAGTSTDLVVDPARIVAVTPPAFQELRDRLFAAGGEGAPLGSCPSCGTDIKGWAHTAGVVEVEPQESDTWVRRALTGERQVSVQPCGHVFPESNATAGDGTESAYIAADDLPPSVAVTVGEGEPSTFGGLTADGGSGSGNHTSPDATDVRVTTEPEGGEQPSVGTSSSTSPKKRRTNSGEPKQSGRPRARATGNRSKQDPEDNSTAGSTATSGLTTAGSDE